MEGDIDLITLAAAQSYVKKTAEGLGAVKGKDGVSVVGSRVNDDHTLTFLMSDGSEINAGNIGYDILTSIKDVEENSDPNKLANANVVKEVFQSVSDGKEKIASAITDKGVETDATATFQEMAENIGKISGGDSMEFYEGEYDITPKAEKQTLETKDKAMKQNVTVAEIPYHEVSNDTGTTVIIGG